MNRDLTDETESVVERIGEEHSGRGNCSANVPDMETSLVSAGKRGRGGLRGGGDEVVQVGRAYCMQGLTGQRELLVFILSAMRSCWASCRGEERHDLIPIV